MHIHYTILLTLIALFSAMPCLGGNKQVIAQRPPDERPEPDFYRDRTGGKKSEQRSEKLDDSSSESSTLPEKPAPKTAWLKGDKRKADTDKDMTGVSAHRNPWRRTFPIDNRTPLNGYNK